jgi:glycosyltransferase involved in cell wall biosynthesis
VTARPPISDLSVFLIVKNEADRLAQTLHAVRDLTDDLVVVDSGSSDGTQAIAERFGARVILNRFEGYGPQKRFAEDQCRHGWLLNIDADEVVPEALAEEMREALATVPADIAGFRLRIAEVFPGEGAPHRLAYALDPVRLYRKDKGRYSASIVHDRVEFAGGARFGTLKTLVHHHSVRSLGDQTAKLNAYSTMQADDLAARGKTIGTWRLFVEFPGAFFKAYVLRRHFVRGVYGFMTAMNYAYFRWLRVAKHIERRRLAGGKDGKA